MANQIKIPWHYRPGHLTLVRCRNKVTTSPSFISTRAWSSLGNKLNYIQFPSFLVIYLSRTGIILVLLLVSSILLEVAQPSSVHTVTGVYLINDKIVVSLISPCSLWLTLTN